MSTRIENEVVEMQFDNRDFEKNVSTSLDSLDKLKTSLKFDDSSKGLNKLSDSIKGLSFDPLVQGLQTVQTKFSALEIMGATVIANLTNSFVNFAKRIANEYLFGNITGGMQEYELKMGSIQTILANAKTKEGLPVTLEMVNEQLQELNKYADLTIYSFKDMTANIGKFTNAGVDLETAVKAIQGVSNVAAVSGANAQEASRAMYNFAQALSAGYVKLIDWKSIENANMATVEFKNQLLETAVAAGTVEKTADGMYKVLTTNANGSSMGDAISATKNFNDSLAYQWMTTEVLTTTLGKYSDATTDVGKKAFAAAQDVKTFSQLLDTVKEGIGSGWANTFEIIIGDFEEAKQLWSGVYSVLNDIINASADSRNALLKDWKDLGGRTALIDAVRNAWNALLSVVTPIKEAFRDIFPKITGEQLADISNKLRDFTENLKLSDKQQKDLHNTFRGIFSILKVVVDVAKEIFSVVGKGASVIANLASKVLEVTGAIGEWVANLVDATDIAGAFGDIFEGIGGAIGEFASFVGDKLSDVKDLIKDVLHIDDISFGDGLKNAKENFDEFTEGIKSNGIDVIFENIGKAATAMKDTVIGALRAIRDFIADSPIVQFFKILIEKIKQLGRIIVKNFAPVIAYLGEKIKELNFKKIFDFISALAVSGALYKIAKPFEAFSGLLSKLTDGAENISEAGGGIKTFFNSLTDTVGEFQKSIKAKTLKEIAISIGILAAALLLLSAIDEKDMTNAIGAITALFGELVGSMMLLGKSTLFEKGGIASLVGIMIGLSVALALMAGALAKVAKQDPDKMKSAMVAIFGLLAELSGVAILMGKVSAGGPIMSGAGQLILMAVAIDIIASAVKKLAKLDSDQLLLGITSIEIILTSLWIVVERLGKTNTSGMQGIAAGLIGFALAIKIIAGAVKSIGKMKVEDVVLGVGAIFALIFGIYKFTTSSSFNKIGAQTGFALILIATSLTIIAGAMKIMASMDLEHLARGLIGIGGALLAVVLFAKAVPKNLPAIAAGLLIAANAILVISAAFAILDTLSDDGLVKGIIAIGSTLLMLAVAVTAMKGALGGAAALAVCAASLALLAPVLILLGTVQWDTIIKSIIFLGGALAVLIAAAYAASGAIPALLALGAAMFLLGAGVALLGVGLTSAAVGLTAFATSIVTSGGIILAAIPLLINGLITSFGTLLNSFLNVIIENVPAIGKALLALIKTACEVVIKAAPDILAALKVLLEGALKFLVEETPVIIESIFTVITDILAGIASHTAEMIDKLLDVLINIIDGLGKGLSEKAPEIRDAILSLLRGILDVILSFFGIHSPSTVFAEIGVNLIQGLINGIVSMVSAVFQTIINLVTGIFSTITGFFGDFFSKGAEILGEIGRGIASKFTEITDSIVEFFAGIIEDIKGFFTKFFDKGKELFGKLKDGLWDGIKGIGSFISDIYNEIKGAAEKIADKFVEIGANIVNGIKKGIRSAAEWFNSAPAVEEMTQKVLAYKQNIESNLGIHSPSTVFAEIGTNMGLGIIKGIEDIKGSVMNSANSFGEDSLKAISDTINKSSDYLEDESIGQFTITPVLDLSNIEDGASKIGSVLNDGTSYDLASQNGSLVAKLAADKTNAQTNYSNDLSNMRNELSEIKNNLANIQIVLDTGTLVGELTTPMDNALGQRVKLAERGISHVSFY